MPRNNCQRRRRAQSIIETLVGIIFLIPVVLFLFDIAVLILANTANDHLAKAAARAAASATDSTGAAGDSFALTAAQNVVNNFKTSPLITDRNLQVLVYNGPAGLKTDTGTAAPGGNVPAEANLDPGAGNCAATTWMAVRVPVPFPYLSNANYFYARAVEPIVSMPPQ
jgi:hypothetical protein